MWLTRGQTLSGNNGAGSEPPPHLGSFTLEKITGLTAIFAPASRRPFSLGTPAKGLQMEGKKEQKKVPKLVIPIVTVSLEVMSESPAQRAAALLL